MAEIEENSHEWKGSNPVASVYLKQSGDEQNKMLLTDRDLVVIYRGKEYVFSHSLFNGLEVGYRKYLFPLIIGGILLPLSFLAIATHDFSPFYLILFLLTGFYLIYTGWSGSPVLSIMYEPKEFDFPLFHISDNLKAFIAFTNAYLLNSADSEERRRYLFLLADEDLEKQSGETEQDLQVPKLNLPAMTWYQWHREDQKKEDEKTVFVIDLFKIKTKVFYEYDKTTHELRPLVEWPVNPEALSEYSSSGKVK